MRPPLHRYERDRDPGELLLEVRNLFVPTADEVAQAHGVKTEQLPGIFEDTLAGLASEQSFDRLNTLYHIWSATRSDPRFEAFARSIATADAILAEYPDSNLLACSTTIRHYSTYVFQPRGLVELSRERPTTTQECGAYGLAGEWLHIPLDRTDGRVVYARREVLEEAARLEAAGKPDANLFHATSSAALPGGQNIEPF